MSQFDTFLVVVRIPRFVPIHSYSPTNISFVIRTSKHLTGCFNRRRPYYLLTPSYRDVCLRMWLVSAHLECIRVKSEFNQPREWSPLVVSYIFLLSCPAHIFSNAHFLTPNDLDSGKRAGIGMSGYHVKLPLKTWLLHQGTVPYRRDPGDPLPRLLTRLYEARLLEVVPTKHSEDFYRSVDPHSEL